MCEVKMFSLIKCIVCVLILLYCSDLGHSKMVAQCPDYWKHKSGTSDCYKIHTYGELRSWSEAVTYCNRYKAKLVSVLSTEFKAWLASILGGTDGTGRNHVWTGAHRQDGKWIWAENEKEVSTDVIDFSGPDDENFNCAAFDASETLNRHKCSDDLHFVCHRDINEPYNCDHNQGWLYIQDHCYLESTKRMSWHDSKFECELVSSHLAFIDDAAENQYAHDVAYHTNSNMWIGLTEEGHKGVFNWTDNGGRKYKNWNNDSEVHQPESMNGAGAAVILRGDHDGRWITERMSEDRSYLCEKPKGSCTSGWNQHKNSCYFFNTEATDKVVYEDAKEQCESVGARLPMIFTESVDNYIKNNLPGDGYYWIGLKSAKGEDVFKWVDGSEFDPNNYTRMSDLDYNDAVQADADRCVFLEAVDDKSIRWIPSDCSQQQYFVCEVPVGEKVTMPIPEDKIYCPDNYTHHGEYCYKFSDDEVFWEKALSLCRSDGGDLASIISWDESDFVADSQLTESWIGLNDRDTADRWLWSDQRQLRITNWGEGEPNGDNENCVHTVGDGHWFDHFCDTGKGYVCKMEASSNPIKPIPSTTTPLPEGGCSYGWKENMYTGECYLFEDKTYTFTDAEAHCNQHSRGSDGHRPSLITLNNPGEQQVLMELLSESRQTPSIWIGLKVDINDGMYWLDNSPVAYVNWANGEPNYDSFYDDATELFTDTGLWNDVENTQRLRFVCEKKGDAYVEPTAPPPTDPTCPSGWIRHNEYCYYYSSNHKNLNYDEAQVDCRSRYNSNLASIASEYENSWINSTFYGSYLYIGLVQSLTTDEWSWLDGTPANYFNWKQGEPNNGYGNEHCTEMITEDYQTSQQGKWNDVPCDESANKEYLCKMLVKTCPTGSSFFNGKCYYISNYVTSWEAARDVCKEFDNSTDLISIHTAEENDFINGLLDNSISSGTWTGLIYVNTSTQNWTWVDETDLDYINWHEGEPNLLESEHCMELMNTGEGWNNLDCGLYRQFGCQYTPTHSIGCPEEWFSYNSRCYYVSNDYHSEDNYLTFNEAETWCQDHGGHLASIDSAEENDMLFSYVLYDTYIGLSDIGSEGSFKWTDGSPVVYTAIGPPDYGDYSPTCAMFYAYNPLWILYSCEEELAFICEKPQEPIPVVTPTNDCNQGDVTHEGSCYMIEKDSTTTWEDARDTCSSDGHLVVINDRFEQAFIAAVLGDMGDRIWIGMSVTTGNDGSSTAAWVDGETVEYTNWGYGEPLAGRGECVEASGRVEDPGLWYITDCSSYKNYICEYPRKGYTSPPTTPTTQPPVWCAQGWTRNDKEHVCYKVFNQMETFDFAVAKCKTYGGNIMSWRDQDEQKVTKTLPDFNITATNAWLGFHSNKEGYYWLDDTPFMFYDWASGQPDKYVGKDCGAMVVDSLQMSVFVCDDYLPFICEVPEGKLVTTVAPPTHTPDKPCPSDPDWLMYGDYCYLIVSQEDDDALSWWGSKRMCEEKGGKLASVHSYEENYWIFSKIYEKSDGLFWLGAQANYNSSWNYWADGTVFDYVNWHKGEPNNMHDQEDCVGIYSHKSGYWNDANCNIKYGRVCKKGYLVTFPPQTDPPSIDGHCPEGWFHSESRCIKIFGKEKEKRLNYTTARSDCKTQGKNGDLLSIHSSLQQATLTAVFGMDWNVDIWIGLKNEGGFRWIDQSEVDYVNWASGEPNNQDHGDASKKENCVQVYHTNGEWNDIYCDLELGYACEIDLDPSIVDHRPLPKCDSPYDSYYKYRDDCYLFKSTKMSWQDAENNCVQDKGHLASAQDFFEGSYLWVSGNEEDNDGFYIGLNNKQDSHQFVWTDNWPVLYTNWGSNQPLTNISTHNCVLVDPKTGLWSTTECSEERSFVCKYHDGKPPTIEPPVDGSCPDTRWQDFGGGYCYFFHTETTKSWGDANTECMTDGGALISIHSEAEKNLTLRALGNTAGNIWIGLIYQTNDYSWSDGTGLDFTMWNDGEPNSDFEKCVEMLQSSGKWNDQNCDDKRKFICKASKKPRFTPQPTFTLPTADGIETTVGKAPSNLGAGAIVGIVGAVLVSFAVVGFIAFRQYNQPKKLTDGPGTFKQANKDPNAPVNKVVVDNVDFGVTDA